MLLKLWLFTDIVEQFAIGSISSRELEHPISHISCKLPIFICVSNTSTTLFSTCGKWLNHIFFTSFPLVDGCGGICTHCRTFYLIVNLPIMIIWKIWVLRAYCCLNDICKQQNLRFPTKVEDVGGFFVHTWGHCKSAPKYK